ncbi:MAG: ABC transporter permease subunit [Peptostreptococcaceae bacterium]|nr:ABC transporter permease subunit [Peptostreptococcaceae bacterium]
MKMIHAEYQKIYFIKSSRRYLVFATMVGILTGLLFSLTTSLTQGRTLSELKPMEIISVNLLGVDVVSILLMLFVAIQIGREFQEGSIASYLSAAPKRNQYFFAKAAIFFLISLVIGIVVALVTLMNGKLLISALDKPMPESDTIRQFVAGCVVMPVFYSLLALCASFMARNTAGGIVVPASVLFLPLFSKLLPEMLQSVIIPILPSSAIHTLSGIATKNSMEYSGMIGAVLILGIWISAFAAIAAYKFSKNDI